MSKVQESKAADLLTAAEAAAYIRMSKSWLDQGRVQGKGPDFHRVGGAIRYRRSDLDAFLWANRVSMADS